MGWTLDFTGPQMILTLKLTSFGNNYYDGSRPDSELNEEQKQLRIKKLPSLLEFYGFVYFFAGFLAGPAFEIQEYLSFTNLDVFNDKHANGKIPPTVKPAVIKLGTSLLLSCGLILSSKYPISWMYTAAFSNLPFLYRYFYMCFSVSLVRYRYYFGWKIAEGGANACGLGYNGVDSKGEYRWDRISNANVLKVEIPENMSAITGNWNIATAKWLKTPCLY